MKIKKARTDPRTPDQEPQLLIQACDCETDHCDRFMMAMIRPVIRPVTGSDELVGVLYVPVEHAQSIVDKVRDLAARLGVQVR